KCKKAVLAYGYLRWGDIHVKKIYFLLIFILKIISRFYFAQNTALSKNSIHRSGEVTSLLFLF
ncbi:hypothetical protein SIM13_08530, partial [Bacillus cereus group sp. BfR-BA-01233]|uniref:hypothetical protein n=1 Tax=Bacillus cereus group TaxID=86661 RepID=UPI00264E731A